MKKPRLLDLFCGAGGCSMGYHRAGFEVVGVDVNPQKNYPFEFHQADALTFPLDGFDVIHASPPCQAHSALRHMWNAKEHLDLIPETRALLIAYGIPYVIENVRGAPLLNPITLCGTMFGLQTDDGRAELWRHRLFESNVKLFPPGPCNHRKLGKVIGVYGGHGRDRRRVVIGVNGHSGGKSVRDGTQGFSVAKRKEAMGISWMSGSELSQAIPPAYCEYIGRQLMEYLKKQAEK
jgi:DNA (cytosine-5)-methyltransferase 1